SHFSEETINLPKMGIWTYNIVVLLSVVCRVGLVGIAYTSISLSVVTDMEKYWEDHPGQEVPIMKPMFYGGPWKVYRGEVPVIGPPPK
ncbi:hypothetical protein KSS87_018937, partial [Heliosperma pusillum]